MGVWRWWGGVGRGRGGGVCVVWVVRRGRREGGLQRRDALFLKRKALMRLRMRFSFLRLVLQRMVTAPSSTRRLGASAVRGVTKRCVGCPIATLAPPPRVSACARGEQGV